MIQLTFDKITNVADYDHIFLVNGKDYAGETVETDSNLVTIGIEGSKLETGYGYIYSSQQKLKSGFEVN